MKKTLLKQLGLFGLFVLCCLIAIFSHDLFTLYNLKIVTIDERLREVSGIEFDKNQRLWAINDGGDGPKLFQVSQQGDINRVITITNGRNLDWEDMTQDDFGHFFIGDFGNNDSLRDWLTIYKIENPIDIKTDKTQAEIIKFTFPKDIDKTNNLAKNHDLEAFVYYKRKLYLFTKNSSGPFDGKTYLFKIGDHAANFEANFIESFTTCTLLQKSCWITSAALSPDRTKLVLLDSQRLWLFEEWQGDNFFSGKVSKINLGMLTQKESVTFYDNNTLVFTDEEYYGIGRNAYQLSLDEAQIDIVRALPLTY